MPTSYSRCQKFPYLSKYKYQQSLHLDFDFGLILNVKTTKTYYYVTTYDIVGKRLAAPQNKLENSCLLDFRLLCQIVWFNSPIISIKISKNTWFHYYLFQRDLQLDWRMVKWDNILIWILTPDDIFNVLKSQLTGRGGHVYYKHMLCLQ